MKKVFIPALCMLALAGMTTSCTDDMDNVVAQNEQAMSKGIKLVATHPGLEMDSHTRTELANVEGEAPKALWSPYDELMIFSRNTAGKTERDVYMTTNKTPARQTTFELDQTDEPKWTTRNLPVALYTESTNKFAGAMATKLNYDVDNSRLEGLHFRSADGPGSTEYQTQQTVKTNQFDPMADWLISQPITEEMKQQSQGEINLKFKRLSSLIRVKIVDKTTKNVLKNQDVQYMYLIAESKDPLIRPFSIDTQKGEIIPMPEADAPISSIIGIDGEEIVRPTQPGGTLIVSPICKIGTEEAVYISTLPATLKKGENITVGFTTASGYQYSKSYTLEADFVLKPGAIHTLTVNMGDEQAVSAPEQGASVDNATLYVHVPGSLTADLVKQAATNAGADLSPEQPIKWNKMGFPRLKIVGSLNASDMKTLNSTLGTYQKPFCLDMQDAQLEGGVLETGMLVNETDYLIINLPWNLTTIQEKSIKCVEMLTIPAGVTTIEANALTSISTPVLRMLCPPSSNISSQLLAGTHFDLPFILLNEKWKGDASLDESTKTWMGKPFDEVFFVKVDQQGKMMNRPQIKMADKHSNLKSICVTTTKVGQITPDVMLDLRYIMNKEDALQVQGPINGRDMGIMIDHLAIPLFDHVDLDLGHARLIGDGVAYTPQGSTHTYQFNQNDVLPTGTFSSLDNIETITFPNSLKVIESEQLYLSSQMKDVIIDCRSLEKMEENVVCAASADKPLRVTFNIPYTPTMNLPVTELSIARYVHLYIENEDWIAPENGGAPQGNVWKGLTWAGVYTSI